RDIGGERPREDMRALADPGDAAAQAPGAPGRERLTGNEDAAAFRRDEASEKGDEARLAAAARRQQRNALARRHGEVEIVEDRLAPPRVAEAQLLDADGRRGTGNRPGRRVPTFRAGQVAALLRQAREPIERRLACRPVVPDGGQVAQRLEE